MRTIVEHVGSAHDETALAALVQAAKDKIQGAQGAFDLDALTPGGPVAGQPVVASSSSRVLWDVLSEAYERIGFGSVGSVGLLTWLTGRDLAMVDCFDLR